MSSAPPTTGMPSLYLGHGTGKRVWGRDGQGRTGSGYAMPWHMDGRQRSVAGTGDQSTAQWRPGDYEVC
jgi:hypothetical protein